MKGLLSKAPGGPETLVLEDMPEPAAGPGEVVVAVKACSINYPDVLIIEDEPLIAMDLEGIVTSIGHEVQANARTHAEAVAAVKARRPGLVLADIQLADGSSGLEAVNEILGEIEVPVIFITAYPEQLLTGLRPEPTFLIPKPFQTDTVKAVVSQALFFDMKAEGPMRRRQAIA